MSFKHGGHEKCLVEDITYINSIEIQIIETLISDERLGALKLIPTSIYFHLFEEFINRGISLAKIMIILNFYHVAISIESCLLVLLDIGAKQFGVELGVHLLGKTNDEIAAHLTRKQNKKMSN